MVDIQVVRTAENLTAKRQNFVKDSGAKNDCSYC